MKNNIFCRNAIKKRGGNEANEKMTHDRGRIWKWEEGHGNHFLEAFAYVNL